MVTEQAALFADPTPELTAPRCRMCSRPARWFPRRSEFAAYCAGVHCDNRERLCQTCGDSFVVNQDGAGKKHCATHTAQATTHPSRVVACAWCGAQGESARDYGRTIWPYLCASCLDPIKHVVSRLKAHHVPHERARLLVSNPTCEVCGRNILGNIRMRGHTKPLLVVDHDHDCCPGSKSCGRCVRGLVCQGCNAALGMIGDNPTTARALADYLERQ